MSKIMPFGKHKGRPVAELPKDYLRWLKDNTSLYGELLEAVDVALGHRRLVTLDDPMDAYLDPIEWPD